MPTMLVTTKKADPTTRTTIRDLGYMVDSTAEEHFDSRKEVSLLLKYMEINDCENAIFFELSKRFHRMWLATQTITTRFEILNHQSIYDLSTTVNYHKNGGHVILFTQEFNEDENLKAVKGVIEEVFKCRADASCERALCFFYFDGVISMRNYVIGDTQEIGPRIDMKLERIFDGCFKGARLYPAKEDEKVAE